MLGKLVTLARRPAGRLRAGSAAVRGSSSASTRGENLWRLAEERSGPTSESARSATAGRGFWGKELTAPRAATPAVTAPVRSQRRRRAARLSRHAIRSTNRGPIIVRPRSRCPPRCGRRRAGWAGGAGRRGRGGRPRAPGAEGGRSPGTLLLPAPARPHDRQEPSALQGEGDIVQYRS